MSEACPNYRCGACRSPACNYPFCTPAIKAVAAALDEVIADRPFVPAPDGRSLVYNREETDMSLADGTAFEREHHLTDPLRAAMRADTKLGYVTPPEPRDKTIRELQTGLPWTAHYHRDFRSNPQTHKDLQHGLLHIVKAACYLAGIIDEAEHAGFDWADPANRERVAKYAADMVICALRMATTCPDGQIDLQRAVEDRLTAKNNQLATVAEELRAKERA